MMISLTTRRVLGHSNITDLCCYGNGVLPNAYHDVIYTSKEWLPVTKSQEKNAMKSARIQHVNTCGPFRVNDSFCGSLCSGWYNFRTRHTILPNRWRTPSHNQGKKAIREPFFLEGLPKTLKYR